MTQSRHDKDLPPTDNKSDSTTDNKTDSLFNESDDDTDDTDDIEVLSNKSNSNTDSDACLSNDKGPRPLEYYLAKVVSLDVKRLQQ
jgi:hypothetical protein